MKLQQKHYKKCSVTNGSSDGSTFPLHMAWTRKRKYNSKRYRKHNYPRGYRNYKSRKLRVSGSAYGWAGTRGKVAKNQVFRMVFNAEQGTCISAGQLFSDTAQGATMSDDMLWLFYNNSGFATQVFANFGSIMVTGYSMTRFISGVVYTPVAG